MSPNMFTDSLAGMVIAEHKGDDPADVTSLTVWLRGDRAAWADQVDTEYAINTVVADLAIPIRRATGRYSRRDKSLRSQKNLPCRTEISTSAANTLPRQTGVWKVRWSPVNAQPWKF